MIHNMPPGSDDAVREDERRQDIARQVEEATEPYRKCIEDLAVYLPRSAKRLAEKHGILEWLDI